MHVIRPRKAARRSRPDLGSPERDATERPQELVDEMALKPGMTVADIGTGVGYMLPYLSRAVGPSGRVVAEDIFDDFLTAAKQRAADAEARQCRVRQGHRDRSASCRTAAWT